MRLAKALIRLRVCAGWSETLLVAHTTLLEIILYGGILTMPAFGNLRRVVCDCAVNRVKYTQTVKGNIKHLHETQQCGIIIFQLL